MQIIFDKTNIVISWMNFFGSFEKIRKENDVAVWLWAYAFVDNTFHLVLLYLMSIYP